MNIYCIKNVYEQNGDTKRNQKPFRQTSKYTHTHWKRKSIRKEKRKKKEKGKVTALKVPAATRKQSKQIYLFYKIQQTVNPHQRITTASNRAKINNSKTSTKQNKHNQYQQNTTQYRIRQRVQRGRDTFSGTLGRTHTAHHSAVNNMKTTERKKK